jgi:glutathione S-transferase
MRLYAIPHSTNVERVALALGHKALDAELVLCDPRDRSAVRRISGQDLVPVLEDEGTVVTDSSRIVEYLERRAPEPPLFPADPRGRAWVRVFVSWFDNVWKRAPNGIADAIMQPRPDRDRIDALGEEVAWSLGLISALLGDREYLAGAAFTAADCAAFPFLKYALGTEAGDDELFHRILVERLAPAAADPAVREWIERVDRRPRSPQLS